MVWPMPVTYGTHRSISTEVQDLDMTQSTAEPSMYFHFKEDRLIVINVAYVDDLLRCGTPEFESL